jgi:hypothetical protein
VNRRNTFHTPRYIRRRNRRYALRGVLYALSLGVAYGVHVKDATLYAGYRGSSDPIALVVLVGMIVVITYATSDGRGEDK